MWPGPSPHLPTGRRHTGFWPAKEGGGFFSSTWYNNNNHSNNNNILIIVTKCSRACAVLSSWDGVTPVTPVSSHLPLSHWCHRCPPCWPARCTVFGPAATWPPNSTFWSSSTLTWRPPPSQTSPWRWGPSHLSPHHALHMRRSLLLFFLFSLLCYQLNVVKVLSTSLPSHTINVFTCSISPAFALCRFLSCYFCHLFILSCFLTSSACWFDCESAAGFMLYFLFC